MPLPAAYDESSLVGFMAAELGETGVSLRLDTDQYDTLAQAANEVQGILATPLAGLTTTADLMKVRAIARWQAWLAASSVAAGRFDLGGSVPGLKRSQVFAMIEKRLAATERAALRYTEVQDALSGGSVAYVSSIGVAGSPYAWPPDEWA